MICDMMQMGVSHFTAKAYEHLSNKYGITNIEQFSDFLIAVPNNTDVGEVLLT